jgi:biopolymer transport protein ExbD
MVPAPHLSLSPAAPVAVPVEIELANDGEISFLGEVVTEEQLKLRLDGVWRTNPDEPVLITKDIAVTRAQWQHIVDLCHAARLKVRVQTRKPGSSASSPDGATTGSKILPLVIGVAADGSTTFEGQHVTLDDLQAKLDAVSKANPTQPIVVEKNPDAAAAMADPVVALCHAMHLPVRVKTAKTFLPPAPPQGANLPQNLPELSPRMHPSLTMMGMPQ